MNTDMVCVPSAKLLVSGFCLRKKGGAPYERYATGRKGFWLNTSLSINRFSRFQDIGNPELAGIEGGNNEAQCL